MKTKFCSFCHKGIAEGCKRCVKGESLVIFISGICSRRCSYCSLSTKRNHKDLIFINERPCKTTKDMILEAKASNSKAAGITGGDPLLFLNRTLKYASTLKKTFGKRFYIHIYLPTKLVTKEKLKKLSKYIDEVRFHPDFLEKKLSEKELQLEIDKIKLASLYWPKSKIGIELPMIPENKKRIFDLLLKSKDIVGFLNLNEFEISDTNFEYITKKYELNKKGYTIKHSIEAGKWIIEQAKKKKLDIKVHLCSADTKNFYQYQNRLRKHKILPFGKKTKEGTVIYYAIYAKNSKDFNKLKKELKKDRYSDEKKLRLIINPSIISKLTKKYKIEYIEEFPTFDAYEIERWAIT